MSRTSLKVTGAQGQGVISVGEICGKGLKRAGYCVFGYREYMSLIKGGHSSYQLDISTEKIESSETRVDILVNFNHHGLEENWKEVKQGGVILHQTPDWDWPEEQLAWFEEQGITIVCLPIQAMLTELKAPAIMGNVLITSIVWTLLGRSDDNLRDMVREQFAHKGEEIIQKNFTCIESGVTYVQQHESLEPLSLPDPNPAQWSDALFLTGSEAMAMGVAHAGCRMYVGYPMTPSSPLLHFIAEWQNETGMVIKQAEDEITAAQMMSGAMCMGTRAMTGTSGGGFDLMTETVSLNGLIENPAVIMLAQRPGPATGLPTWTAQGDLLLAIFAAHGEFPRLVLSVSDSQDCFDLMPEAFNYAEEFQTVVIVLTDKHVAEALYTQVPYDQSVAELRRGNLVTQSDELKKLTSEDRYNPQVPDGISPRWLPGHEAATFCSQGDEHDAAGNVDETSENAIAQMEKRMRKMEKLEHVLPEPTLYQFDGDTLVESASDASCKLLLVSWGSSKGVIVDVMRVFAEQGIDVGYLHYTYLWPLKTERYSALHEHADQVVLLEGNYQAQLGMLLKQRSGLDVDHEILKYDGRPFFFDELFAQIQEILR